MGFGNEIEGFINDYVKDLSEGNASIFAGAGLSVEAGFVNWSGLMEDIAKDLGLSIEKETDLISIAQFHENENQTRHKINQKILEEFTAQTEETKNHRIIARLPISTVWTTNYDEIIEKSFIKQLKITDVKHTNNQLASSTPKRDVVIYKMHGDVSLPDDAILTKKQYEQYHQTHEPFINALTGELTTKTFLFLGFSFTDPNLDYVLSRLNFRLGGAKRQHYCLVKKPTLGDTLNPDQASFDYNSRKQQLVINDLKRYGIKSLLINGYNEITSILEEIERRYKKKTIFISGSAEIYAPFDRNEAINFIHQLSKRLIECNLRIVNGFGWGVGSSVINGALEAIYSKPLRYSESQLILRPFPQFKSGEKELPVLWEEYRQKMIATSGISIFIFGNKYKDEKIVDANGVISEFEISKANGNICIPIACTGYASMEIFNQIIGSLETHYTNPAMAGEFLSKLACQSTPLSDKTEIVIQFIQELTK